MKKTLLALAITAGLTSFAGSAKANYTVQITPKYDIINSYISAWDLTQGSGSFLFGQNLGSGTLNANQSYNFNIPWANGAPVPAGWIFAGDVQPSHVMLSAPNPLIGDWTANFPGNFFPEDSIYNSINSIDKTTLKNFEYYYKTNLLCPPDFVNNLYMFSSAVDGGTFTVTNQAAPEPSTYALFGIGALALIIAYRRKVA